MKSAFTGIVITLLTTPSIHLVTATEGFRSDAQNYAAEAERLTIEVLEEENAKLKIEVASLKVENAKLQTGVTTRLDKGRADETQTLVRCVGDRTTFSTEYGDCTEYKTVWHTFCAVDKDVNTEELAYKVCSECGRCSDSGVIDNMMHKYVVEPPYAYASILNPPEDMRTYSSVWSHDPTEHKRSQIDSPQAWSAASKRIGEYMLIDLGANKIIDGIATQGRHDNQNGKIQAVTKIGVQFSTDGRRYTAMQIFDTPTIGVDTITFSRLAQEVDHRYVKITVKAFHIHPSMRAGVVLSTRTMNDTLRREVSS